MKRSVIISDEHGIYKLPNDLSLIWVAQGPAERNREGQDSVGWVRAGWVGVEWAGGK